jgi:endo-1,4-beta-xylanase
MHERTGITRREALRLGALAGAGVLVAPGSALARPERYARAHGLALRDAAAKRGMVLSTAMRGRILLEGTDPLYAPTAVREFSSLTAESDMKMRNLRPRRGTFSFERADAIANLARAHGLSVRGHTLVWYDSTPPWVAQGVFSRGEMIDILHEHIATVVARYRDVVPVWDVVNEPIDEDGSLRRNVWLDRIGPEYIELAFRFAHEADPNARLFFNDFVWYKPWRGGAWLNTLSRLVRELRGNGVRVDGAGLQMHVSESPGPIFRPPNWDNFERCAERFAAEGIELQVTETDVQEQDTRGTQEQRWAAQAACYHEIARRAAAAGATQLDFWGFTDRYTWIRGTFGIQDAAPLPFDFDYRPKPAYYALKDALLTGRRH